jgi:hypothetical protein
MIAGTNRKTNDTFLWIPNAGIRVCRSGQQIMVFIGGRLKIEIQAIKTYQKMKSS